MNRKQKAAAGVGVVAVAALGFATTQFVSGGAENAESAAAAAETSQTFTFTNVGTATYSIPTVTETTPAPPPVTQTVTVTTSPPPATTAPPPTTTAPPPTTTAPPSSAWPWPQTPEPKLPTGLAVITSGGYQNRDGVEYRGSSLTDNGPVVKNKRVVFRDQNLEWIQVAYPAEDFWMIGGDIGPFGNGTHPYVSSGFVTTVAKRVVFDGVRFHGMHQGTLADHTEGLQVSGVHTLVIRNCVFEDNHVFNLFLRTWVPATIQYVLIENNRFEKTHFVDGREGTYSMRVAGDGDSTKPTDIVIRNNRYPASQPISVDGSAVRVQVYGNIPVP